MKKIQLPQPYATMVALGILQTLPNNWDDVRCGEKIFIYADGLDEKLQFGLEYGNPLHRKIHNEFFLGNIPNTNEYPTQCFIGCVKAYHSGQMTTGWTDIHDNFIFVAVPRMFKTYIKDFNINKTILEEAESWIFR